MNLLLVSLLVAITPADLEKAAKPKPDPAMVAILDRMQARLEKIKQPAEKKVRWEGNQDWPAGLYWGTWDAEIKKWRLSRQVEDTRAYNTVRNRLNWTYPGMHSMTAIINHLLSAPDHRGKFTRDRLEQLSLEQLEKLHSNDHEGRPYLAAAPTADPACPT